MKFLTAALLINAAAAFAPQGKASFGIVSPSSSGYLLSCFILLKDEEDEKAFSFFFLPLLHSIVCFNIFLTSPSFLLIKIQ